MRDMSGLLFSAAWAVAFIVAIVLILKNRQIRKTREYFYRAEEAIQPPPEEIPEGEETWVDVAAFPMDHIAIQPFGAQMVTRKTFRDHLADYQRLLSEAGIPYRTHMAQASTMQAEAVQVPHEHWKKAKAIFEELRPRTKLF